jgi:peptidoglycan/LPS O-acetylase OafA/YrhL
VAGVSSPASRYRPDVDGLRALAVLSVIGYHAFPRVIRGGFVGVDVFFVISGYLISGLILEDLALGRFSYRRFYARRFRRIFPALIVVLAACLVYGGLMLAPDEFRELGKQAAAGAGFSSNLLLWSEAGYFDQNATTKPLLHLWSLGVEEQFYIASPILLVLAYGGARGAGGGAGAGGGGGGQGGARIGAQDGARRGVRHVKYLCAGLALLSFASNIVLTHTAPSAAFYLPVPRFWELLLGALLAYREHSVRALGAPAGGLRFAGPEQARAALGLAMIGASLAFIDADRAFPGWWALLPTVGTALLISAPGAWINSRLLSSASLVAIGLISYPLYLWHWVLLTFMRIAHYDEETSRLDRFAAIAASLVLAWVTYRWIEKPIRFSGRRDALPRTLIASMALCALAGVAVFMSDGFAFRYPAPIRALAAFHYDEQKDFYEHAYRDGTCFLGVHDGFASVASQCVDPPDGVSRLIVLWGDSHAASLYPGLRAQQRRGGYRLAQFTASACLPVLGLTSDRRPSCRAFNDFVVREIKSLSPDAVIIEAHWALYSPVNGWPNFDPAALRETVRTLERMGIRRVVVMGSLPSWKIYQPRVAFEIWRQAHVLEDRTREYLDPAPFAADTPVRAAVAGTGAIFVSPIALLCNDGGCLISAEPHAAVPIAWDNDHLSIAGSELVAGRAIESVVAPPGPPT